LEDAVIQLQLVRYLIVIVKDSFFLQTNRTRTKEEKYDKMTISSDYDLFQIESKDTMTMDETSYSSSTSSIEHSSSSSNSTKSITIKKSESKEPNIGHQQLLLSIEKFQFKEHWCTLCIRRSTMSLYVAQDK
jgi:hypothetical protein